MNEELEQQLRTLPLRSPSASLDTRVSRTLADSPPRWMSLGLWFLPAALAASVAFAVMIQPTSDRTAPNDPRTGMASVAPLRVDSYTSQVTPGEMLMSAENEPVQPLRVQNVYHSRWYDEKADAYFEMTVPDDQVVLVSAPVY